MIVTSGQTFTLSSGESDTGIVVDRFGTLIVLAGGTATDTSATGSVNVAGGMVIATALTSGHQTLTSGGVSIDTTITSNGLETVSAGSVASGTTVTDNGFQVVRAGGTASGTVLGGVTRTVGEQSLTGFTTGDNASLSGSTSLAVDTIINNGGYQLIQSAGAVAIGAVVNSGGMQTVFFMGVASGTIIGFGGDQHVEEGTAVNTTISGGEQHVAAAGFVSGTIISSGGTQFVSSGGHASGTTISFGGIESVLSSGTTVSTTILNGGLQNVSPSGRVSGTIIEAGGVQHLDGRAFGTLVESGGTEMVVPLSGIAQATTVFNGGVEYVSSGSRTIDTAISGGTVILAAGAIVSGTIDFRSAGGGQLQIVGAAMPTNTIAGLASGDSLDLSSVAFDSNHTTTLAAGNILSLTENGSVYQFNLDPNQDFTGGSFLVAPDASGGTLVTESRPPSQSPAVLNDFGWAQGWGSPDNPRITADADGNGTTDYIGFGAQSVFVAYGGTFAGNQGTGPGFSAAVASVNDFGTAEGYTASVQRGVAATGAGVGDTIYGQGFAGVYWYAATGETPLSDAAGKTYDILQYQSTPNLYGNFGSQQGWTPSNGFQIVKTAATDGTASILGFGAAGIVVGPQAFAAGAVAAASYVIPFAAGNNFGWNQQVDIRTFTDAGGNTVDLNHDGVADFVGMGPQGLVYAMGTNNGGTYGLGALTTAHIGAGGSADLGDAQGWNDATTPRYVVRDAQTGDDDILAFGAAGVYVAMGQDPATHGGEPFGQLYLAMPDFGSSQGWSVSQTPRIVGDVNGDGIPDIVGFGANATFVAIGSRDTNGNLHFALDPTRQIADFGYGEGWSGSSPQTVRTLGDVAGTGPADLILSGALNTQVWQFG